MSGNRAQNFWLLQQSRVVVLLSNEFIILSINQQVGYTNNDNTVRILRKILFQSFAYVHIYAFLKAYCFLFAMSRIKSKEFWLTVATELELDIRITNTIGIA